MSQAEGASKAPSPVERLAERVMAPTREREAKAGQTDESGWGGRQRRFFAAFCPAWTESRGSGLRGACQALLSVEELETLAVGAGPGAAALGAYLTSLPAYVPGKASPISTTLAEQMHYYIVADAARASEEEREALEMYLEREPELRERFGEGLIEPKTPEAAGAMIEALELALAASPGAQKDQAKALRV